MKKIITLITMFVLSAGCLMAQGVFTYQAVVYDGTSLVVDQDVTAAVTITDGTHLFTQTLPSADNADYPTIHTSLNGLAVLFIGDDEDENFMAMDWSKATIKVDFTVLGENSSTINGTAEQIPAVPYALQANAKITTPMVVDYISHATMDDVMAILEATEKNKDAEHNNVTLHDTVLHAIIDSIMAHYDLVKDIMMSYIADADAQDVDQLFTAMTGNDALMEALATIVKSNLMTPEGKAMIYEVLVDYASRLTDGDVDAILDAIPTDARNEAVSKALVFFLNHTVSVEDQDPLTINYKDEDIHAALEEIAKYYIEHISVSQVNTLIATIEGNEGAMDILVPQFNAWMDEYVKKVVNEYLAEHYYLCEDGAFDLCNVWNELNGSVDNCLTVNSNTFTFEYVAGDEPYYKGMLNCTPGSDFTEYNLAASTVSINGQNLSNYGLYVDGGVILEISPDALIPFYGSTPPSSFSADVHLEILCNNPDNPEPTYDFTGTYTEQQGGGGGSTPSICLSLADYVGGNCYAAQVDNSQSNNDNITYSLSIPYSDGDPVLDVDEYDSPIIKVVSLNGNPVSANSQPILTDCKTLKVNSDNSTIYLSIGKCAFSDYLNGSPLESFVVEFNVYDPICANNTFTVQVCYGNN